MWVILPVSLGGLAFLMSLLAVELGRLRQRWSELSHCNGSQSLQSLLMVTSFNWVLGSEKNAYGLFNLIGIKADKHLGGYFLL